MEKNKTIKKISVEKIRKWKKIDEDKFGLYVYDACKLQTVEIDDIGKIDYFLPDPVDLLLRHVKISIENINNIKTQIKDSPLKQVDKTAEKFDLLEEEIDTLFINAISIPVILICALETFANNIIYNKTSSHLPLSLENEVQRRIHLEKKLFEIIPDITLKARPNEFKAMFTEINEIRNKIIHHKTKSKERQETKELLEDIIKINWAEILEETEKTIANFSTIDGKTKLNSFKK